MTFSMLLYRAHVGEGLGLLSTKSPDVIICSSQQIFNERLSKIHHLRRRTPSPLLHQHWLHNVHMVKRQTLLRLFASPLADTYILRQPPPGNTISSLPQYWLHNAEEIKHVVGSLCQSTYRYLHLVYLHQVHQQQAKSASKCKS